MKFNQMTILEPMPVAEPLIKNLSKYSKNETKYFDTPAEDDDEKIKRIADSDCLLVSFNHRVSAEVIEKTNLKYIGLCSTLYKGKNCNIDLEAAEKRGITVTGILDYGTIGTVEFTIAQIITYLKSGPNRELKDKDVGIIGMGDVGSKIAKALLFFKANVYYYNRSRKPEIEQLGVKYLDLPDLLKKVEILSLNLPRNTKVLRKAEFDQMRVKMLVNISLDTPFDLKAFYAWLDKPGNTAIFDLVGAGDIRPHKNIIIYDNVSGYTEEAKIRQVQKVEENIRKFLHKNSLTSV